MSTRGSTEEILPGDIALIALGGVGLVNTSSLFEKRNMGYKNKGFYQPTREMDKKKIIIKMSTQCRVLHAQKSIDFLKKKKGD
jgi:hypothetical protein